MWRMTPQNLPVIKTITSIEQFDYLKKQLEVSVLPHFFTYRQMLKQKIQSFASLLYILGLFSSFIPFIPLKKEQSQLLFLGAAICYGILLLQNFVSSSLKKYYLWQYQPEIDTHQYLVTQGEILQIHIWNQKQKWLELTIEFQDISNDYIRKRFRIPYPQIEKFKNPLDPKELIGQTVELCLLPQSYLLLQIQIIPTDIHQLQFVNQQVDLWSLHQQGILTNQVCIAPTIHSLQFIRAEQGAHFSIYCYCPEYPDFEITSAIANFEDVERTLFESFDDLDFNHYQKLKYSNNIQNTLLYQVPNTLTNRIKKQRKSEIEINTSVCFVIFMILFFIALFYLPMIWAIVGLLSGISLIIAVYFYYMLKYSEYILPTKL